MKETDYFAGVLLNGYADITQFYTEMSSVLPFHKNDYTVTNNTRRRIPIPHLILQALDDPLSTWRTNSADDARSPLYPSNLISKDGQTNIVLLLTATGGHVGWPIGWWPHSWEYMNDMVAAGFVTAWDKQLHSTVSPLR